MRLVKLIVIGVLAGAVVSATALAAPGKRIDRGTDRGLPLAYSTKGRALNPKTLLIRITATPSVPVQVGWYTSCARKLKGKARHGEYTIGSRKLVKIKKGFKRAPSDCLVTVVAGFEDASQQGKIKIEVFARGKRARRG